MLTQSLFSKLSTTSWWSRKGVVTQGPVRKPWLGFNLAELCSFFSHTSIGAGHSEAPPLWYAAKVCGHIMFPNLDCTQDVQKAARTWTGICWEGPVKWPRIQTVERFEIRKWKEVKREHSTAARWSPDLLWGQGSTNETYHQLLRGFREKRLCDAWQLNWGWF